ncbi:MAG: hypothetical protein N3G80_03030 [Candidatus Micrarchaeota archaeon]|nr:hypothetical protein [Candidatus Micrarchaeota archaeon]
MQKLTSVQKNHPTLAGLSVFFRKIEEKTAWMGESGPIAEVAKDKHPSYKKFEELMKKSPFLGC